MSRLQFLFLFVIFSALLGAQSSAPASEDKIYGNPAERVPPEKMPEYPGGIPALYAYIKTNLRYPQVAIDSGYTGKCFVKFVVNRDGSVSDISVDEGVARCPECDAEALRVVANIPERWKPGMQDGRAVRVYYTLPFNFSSGKSQK